MVFTEEPWVLLGIWHATSQNGGSNTSFYRVFEGESDALFGACMYIYIYMVFGIWGWWCSFAELLHCIWTRALSLKWSRKEKHTKTAHVQPAYQQYGFPWMSPKIDRTCTLPNGPKYVLRSPTASHWLLWHGHSFIYRFSNNGEHHEVGCLSQRIPETRISTYIGQLLRRGQSRYTSLREEHNGCHSWWGLHGSFMLV